MFTRRYNVCMYVCMYAYLRYIMLCTIYEMYVSMEVHDVCIYSTCTYSSTSMKQNHRGSMHILFTDSH